jgi:hypothetical protein
MRVFDDNYEVQVKRPDVCKFSSNKIVKLDNIAIPNSATVKNTFSNNMFGRSSAGTSRQEQRERKIKKE